MAQKFLNRRDAGKQLAAELRPYKKDAGVFVFGLPRGGMVVAYEVANALNAPLDVFLVRKLGVPWQPELAMGAIAEGGFVLMNENIVADLNISKEEIAQVIEQEKKELHRRHRLYRGRQAPPVVEGREVILIDDGLATGATVRVAVKALKERGVKKLIVAVPVGDRGTCDSLRGQVDDLVCLSTPHPLESIGQWYEEFEQTSDEEVIQLLGKSHPRDDLIHRENKLPSRDKEG